MSSLADLPPLQAQNENVDGLAPASEALTPDSEEAAEAEYMAALQSTTPSAPVSPFDCGSDILDSQLALLEKTLESADAAALQDMHDSVIPLASTLLEIGEKQGDAQKLMRAHQVLAETAHMGIWSFDSLDKCVQSSFEESKVE